MTIEQLIKSIADLYTDCIQKALDEARQSIKNDAWDLGTLTRNASWSAYCEGLEQALMIVDECTAAGLKRLAERKVKAEGPDMNAAYPNPKVR